MTSPSFWYAIPNPAGLDPPLTYSDESKTAAHSDAARVVELGSLKILDSIFLFSRSFPYPHDKRAEEKHGHALFIRLYSLFSCFSLALPLPRGYRRGNHEVEFRLGIAKWAPVHGHTHTHKNEPFAPLLKPFLYLLLPDALPTPKKDSKEVAGQQRPVPSHSSEAFHAS
jgi:hypothetical protein